MGKEKLYLQNLKERLNNEETTYIYDESQTGPQEEPCLLAYKMDVKQFQKYERKIKRKKK